jgi:hypothetical protein
MADDPNASRNIVAIGSILAAVLMRKAPTRGNRAASCAIATTVLHSQTANAAAQ